MLLVMLAILVGVFVRVLADPTPVTPDRTAITGTWTNPDGATLAFAADGTVTASHMPPSRDLPDNGTGTWKIEPRDPNAHNGYLTVTIDGSGAELITSGDPRHPAMFVYLGDPDENDRFTFTHADR